MNHFDYRHVITFEETNLVGNVYYVNHLRWQGRCRELFLHEHAPGVIAELQRGLSIVTTKCSCEYLAELRAFDQVIIRMRLGDVVQNRVTLLFEYLRPLETGDETVARGEQQIASMRREGDTGLVPTPLPPELMVALQRFATP